MIPRPTAYAWVLTSGSLAALKSAARHYTQGMALLLAILRSTTLFIHWSYDKTITEGVSMRSVVSSGQGHNHLFVPIEAAAMFAREQRAKQVTMLRRQDTSFTDSVPQWKNAHTRDTI